MQDIHTVETAHPTIPKSQPEVHAIYLPNEHVRRWMWSRRQSAVILGMISWDVLLALAMWQAAFALQVILGHGSLSVIAIVSIMPNIVAWLGLRAATAWTRWKSCGDRRLRCLPPSP